MKHVKLIVLCASVAALAASFVEAQRIDGRLAIGAGAAGVYFVVPLGMTALAALAGIRRAFDRGLAAIGLAGAVMSAVLASFLIGMMGLGRALGPLFTLGASSHSHRVILVVPLQITLVGAVMAGLGCLVGLFRPERQRTRDG